MSLQKADDAIRNALKSQSQEANSRQDRLQKLGINVEKTRRLDFRIVAWTMADDVLHNQNILIEARIRVGVKALNAVSIWALKAMDNDGAREVLKHYRMLLAEWADKRRELSGVEDKYNIVKNVDTVRRRVTAWAERNLIPWMEKIADSSWGKDNVEPELPIVLENNQQVNPYSALGGNVVDQKMIDAMAKAAAASV